MKKNKKKSYFFITLLALMVLRMYIPDIVSNASAEVLFSPGENYNTDIRVGMALLTLVIPASLLLALVLVMIIYLILSETVHY